MTIPVNCLPKPIADALRRGDMRRLVRYLDANPRPSRASMTQQHHP